MSGVSRSGMTSSSLKKARLEAERSKLVGRMTDCDKTDDALQEKNTKYDCIFKLIIMGDTVSNTSLAAPGALNPA